MIGIVYYSKNGNTKILAELLAQKYDGKIITLEEKGKRNGLFGFIKSGFQAATRKQSRLIGTPWDCIAEFDKLYLCTPIWAGNITPAMNTFMANASLANKEVTIVTVMADPKLNGVEKAHGYLSDLVKEKGGIVLKCIGLNGTSPYKQGEKNHIKRQFDTCL